MRRTNAFVDLLKFSLWLAVVLGPLWLLGAGQRGVPSPRYHASPLEIVIGVVLGLAIFWGGLAWWKARREGL